MAEGVRVLIVEDNVQNLELVEFLLEEAGHEVISAMDAGGARERVAAVVPDLILMDMSLPGTDGLTLVREFRKDERLLHVPIVALTAHAMRGDRERFLAGGCDGYLSKPIDTSTFVRDVETFLKSSGEAPKEQKREP